MAKQLSVSPAGRVKWCHVNKPNTKFDADGVFTVDLILEGADADNFKAAIEKAAKAAKAELEKADAKVKKYDLYVPFGPNEDKEGNDLSGTVFKFKNKAVGKKKDGTTFNVTVSVFDCKGQQLKDCKLGRGSLVKVAYVAFPFASASLKKAGVGLRLSQVLVKELVEFGDGAQSAFGEEEGYVAQQPETAEFGAEGAEQPADAGTGDF